MKLNDDQSIAFLKIKSFLNTDDQVFILKGHAGTGKTTLVKEVIYYLKSIKRQPILMASTGRAARILFEKTDFPAETAHRTIYHLYETGLSEDDSFRFSRFELHLSEADPDAVFLCDESSMISNRQIEKKELSFGTGKLLTDLMTHIGKRKIIFIGDPAQLPPVNASFSPALSEKYFLDEFGLKAHTAKLQLVMRYKSGTGKYENTVALREIVERGNIIINPIITARRFNDYHVYNDENQLVSSYSALISQFGIDQMCFIANSNSKVHELNEKIRKIIFKGKILSIRIGEPLLVMQNNYLYNFYNGDSIEVVNVLNDVETRGGVSFRQIDVQTFDKEGMIRKRCLIVDNLLYTNIVNLDVEQETNLYRDFVIRMKNRNILEKTPEFREALKSDLYLNALRVKFGYAMTCHKAQGGEWPHVFLVLERHIFTAIPKDQLFRWLYTALSRASSNVHLSQNYCIR